MQVYGRTAEDDFTCNTSSFEYATNLLAVLRCDSPSRAPNLAARIVLSSSFSGSLKESGEASYTFLGVKLASSSNHSRSSLADGIERDARMNPSLSTATGDTVGFGGTCGGQRDGGSAKR